MGECSKKQEHNDLFAILVREVRMRGESRAINLMWPDMFYSHKGPMGVIYPCLFQLPDEIEAKFQRLPPSPFSTTATPTELMEILPGATESGTSKMAVNKLVLLIYSIVDEIEIRFQQKTLYLRCPVTQEKNGVKLNQTRS